jgi:hypothetical protein
MDLGTSTYTDFKIDETVAGYIAENIDLFGCDMNLIHSHNQMACWFSGTDISTLRSEGNDQNCFVSLIVNNAGTYCAAITRKVQTKLKVTTEDLGTSYEFFGEGSKTVQDEKGPVQQNYKDDSFIEYFMLDVEVEQVDNPLAYLDTRFDEIQEAKKKRVAITPTVINPPIVKASEDGNHSPWIPNNAPIVNPASRAFGNDFDEDYSFREYLNNKKATKEPTLFSEDEMAEMIDTSGWEPDPTIIHRLVCQMITCSLIVSDNIDLKQWITKWMEKKYKEIFGPDCNESSQFHEWKEYIVEFMLNEYMFLEDNIPNKLADDYDLLQSKIATAMYNELYQYNPKEDTLYLNDYMEVLTRYIYE